MKSIEFILPSKNEPSGSLAADFAKALASEFGGYTRRDADRYRRNLERQLVQDPVQIFEVATATINLDQIQQFAAPFLPSYEGCIEAKIEGETFLLRADGAAFAEKSPANVSDWPREFDIAIQTVIGPELHAVQDHFGMDRQDVRSVHGTYFYRGKVNGPNREYSVVVCCQSSAGNDAAAIFAERLITMWSPKVIFLTGIAAGRRAKCRIGDVVTPRVVVDNTRSMVQDGQHFARPEIVSPPHEVLQQLLNFRLAEHADEWHSSLAKTISVPVAPLDASDETVDAYANDIAALPSAHDAAIYSSDVLLRDSEVLEVQSKTLHQQIRIGEMEAAGFMRSCHTRSPPIPWYVVRGVSDFGDEFKSDDFHAWAAHSAVSFLYILIKYGINIDLLAD